MKEKGREEVDWRSPEVEGVHDEVEGSECRRNGVEESKIANVGREVEEADGGEGGPGVACPGVAEDERAVEGVRDPEGEVLEVR